MTSQQLTEKAPYVLVLCNSAARYDIVTAYYAFVRSYYDLAGTQRIAGPLLRHFLIRYAYLWSCVPFSTKPILVIDYALFHTSPGCS